jgi:hypothetical protein
MSEQMDGVDVAEDVAAEVAALRARVVQAELRTEAVRAGMVDLDGVRLIDASGLVLGPDGVEGAADLVARMREAKPWLFGRGGGSSSSAGRAPVAAAPKAKTAMEMSEDEWRAARAELLRRR